MQLPEKTSPLDMRHNGPYNIVNHLESIGHLMSVDEVAEVLGLSKTTVYRMSQSRQVPSLMLGGTRKYDPSTLAAWLIKKDPQLAVVARQLRQQAA
jgi:excisionase family DNA binding protein